MKTFEQFVENQTLEPMIWEAAQLFVDLDIDPVDYFENWALGSQQAAQAMGHASNAVTQGMAGMGNLGKGAVAGAWNAGQQAGTAFKNSPMGRGVQGWWRNFNSGERKLEKAASLIQRAMQDPVITGLNGGAAAKSLSGIIRHLNKLAQDGRATRPPI
jgi:hypothetical protein